MLTTPMWALFEVGIIADKMARKCQREEEAEEEHAS